ncbi:sulfite exporter TauE/SafE family protein [Pelagimonas varians]|uniref:Probable membrane transporter protein n=1 Tax=Pelagimonas varians TaxID=696760 RepID=A0A238L4Y1_9RHOB|nr:sulfite exporter TauE/SafE family protein [Pelagimonas varians]PYG25603.1 putative membrane protein YfcA [Pelagimonas varians]SMX49881.1 Sulfite exporter TauE/SafE [Pelagimonas varians]
MTDLTTLQISLILCGVIFASITAGILAGLLGVGGGIVLVPVLFWILSFTDFPPELSMHMAVATSLATIIFTSVSSARAHNARGAVDRNLLRSWAPGLVFGALAGGILARYIDANGLRAIFGGIAVLVAINMLLPRTLVISSTLPEGWLPNGFLSGVTGLFSALMGIGGGTLSVPLLSAFSVEIRRAVGTAAAFGFLIAVPAGVGFVISGWNVPDRPPFSLGYINYAVAALILPFTVGFAPLGARLAHTLDTVWIKRGFALFLMITAVNMLAAFTA